MRDGRTPRQVIMLELAAFVIARADEELWALDIGSAAMLINATSRLRAQALARREVADQYLRLVVPDLGVDDERAPELLRTVCLMARLDRGHPDYEAAINGCPLDCDTPLW